MRYGPAAGFSRHDPVITLKYVKSTPSVIRKALEEYPHKIKRARFLEDARRQSMLADPTLNEDEEIWFEHADSGLDRH